MKTTLTVVLTAALICLSLSEASARKSFSPGEGLSQIVNHTNADVQYTIGNPHVEIIGSDAALHRIQVGVSNRSLKISFADNRSFTGEDVLIMVSAENVGSFMNYGSGDIKAERIEAVSVSLQSFGSGDITVGTVECSGFQIGVCGSGDITVDRSESATFKVLVQGSGDATVRRLEASAVEATLQGSGDLSLPVIDAGTLRVISQGSGDVNVGGEVSTAVLTGQGTGDINARSLKTVKTTKIQQGLGDIYN